MRNGKYAARRTSGTKAVSLLLAVLVLVGCSVGATMAWLTATTGTVTNTFTVGKVDITLQEHQYVEDSNTLGETTVQGNSYKLIPGKNMPKDPFVTVTSGSEKCWLFVRIDEAYNEIELEGEDQVVVYGWAEDWETFSLTDTTYGSNGIEFRYRIVDSNEMNKALYVLGKPDGCNEAGHVNGCVTINHEVTSDFTATPVLKFTAAAIQYDGLEVVGGTDPGVDYEGNAAKAAFAKLPSDFTSTANKNTAPAT